MRKKILLIDDSSVILSIVSSFVEAAGYEVITASNGEIGINLAINKMPDLILCDVNMPGLSGFDIISIIRTNKITAAIPFIFLSVSTDKDTIREGMVKGADDYITKPFKKQELLDAINAQWKRNARIEAIVDSRIEESIKSLEKNITIQINNIIKQVDNLNKKNIRYRCNRKTGRIDNQK